MLCQVQSPGRAVKDYLRFLELAAKQSEVGVDAVLGQLLEWNVPITPTVVADHLAHNLGLPRATEVTITTVDLSMYDGLLETKEDMPLTDQPTCTNPLKACLRDLHLPTIRDEYESAAGRAHQGSSSYERYLLDLAERECEAHAESDRAASCANRNCSWKRVCRPWI